MSAAERASEVSSAQQANEWVVRANEQTEEQMAQYSTRRFHIIWNHCAVSRNLVTKMEQKNRIWIWKGIQLRSEGRMWITMDKFEAWANGLK